MRDVAAAIPQQARGCGAVQDPRMDGRYTIRMSWRGRGSPRVAAMERHEAKPVNATKAQDKRCETFLATIRSNRTWTSGRTIQ